LPGDDDLPGLRPQRAADQAQDRRLATAEPPMMATTRPRGIVMSIPFSTARRS